MIYRILITWLIISILGMGVSIARDIHMDGLSSHDAGHSITQADEDSVNSSHDSCHGLIHLLGLNSSQQLPSPIQIRNLSSIYSVNFRQTLPDSIDRPPRHR